MVTDSTKGVSSVRDFEALLVSLTELREQLAHAPLRLEVSDAADARRKRDELVAQFDDYVLPRLRSIDAPLLTVVGGSTGAGKSTLVNSLLRREVTPSGVLRPTTRAPVLAHAPDDERWFADTRILPGLTRTKAAVNDTTALRLVAEPALRPGLAVLDAPDIDSVVTANRELATELLAAADLWLFVTTAARYADAVPWGMLRDASARSAAVAIVLNRVPPEAIVDVAPHLQDMLRGNGLDAPLFVVPETATTEGLLPEDAVLSIRRWLDNLAADAASRAAVVRRTLDGVLDSLTRRVPDVTAAVREQERTAEGLRRSAEQAYAQGVAGVDTGMRDGSLLHGEVLARWQEFVGTGEFLRNLESRLGWLRDRVTAAVMGRPRPEQRLEEALETGVEALLRAEADAAAERADAMWRSDAAGRVLLEGAGRLDRSSPDLAQRAQRLVRDWQGSVLELVRTEGQSKRTGARVLSYGVNAAGLVVMVAVFASTHGLTGAEVAIAGGTSALGQKLLEALLGDQAVRDLAATAREDLRVRVAALFGEEQERYVRLVAPHEPRADAAEQLSAALAAAESARTAEAGEPR